MIISRTPFRVSFFGGGTDYPDWYREMGGQVLGTAIDKYCYITCRYLPPFFEHKHRIVYSKVENVKDYSEIQHAAARAVLEYMGINDGVEIHHDGDLPARTGLGTSSSFTVGLLNSLYALQGRMQTKMKLAKEAVYIERDVLKEHVGSQDQTFAACGGLKKISFGRDDSVTVLPLVLPQNRLMELQSHLMLVFTGFTRFATKIAKTQIESIPRKKTELISMGQMVDEAVNILTGNNDINEFGKLLHESWKLKRSLTDKISTPQIDNIYDVARNTGAIGGKVLGAGGGGFMIFFAEPEKQYKIRNALKNLLHIPFKFENSGSEIIFHRDSYIPEKPLVSFENSVEKLHVNIDEQKPLKNRVVEIETKSIGNTGIFASE
ncbi:MAG: hypothetical protein K8R02_01660 [Anaerohalosphaeraceae bacterium]|nr:hypothetical protein [Anaerohalosphaeraceae bacterium]